jgi:hypothetical protein
MLKLDDVVLGKISLDSMYTHVIGTIGKFDGPYAVIHSSLKFFNGDIVPVPVCTVYVLQQDCVQIE